MELASLVPKELPQNLGPSRDSAFRAHASASARHYPSPTKEEPDAATGVARYMAFNMASASPTNAAAAAGPSGSAVSPLAAAAAAAAAAATPKPVTFELLFPEGQQFRAGRLPLRVAIYPHDTTDSIVTTVKNFYGLYSGPSVSKGVSFEDEHANTLIARYENLRHNMVVYVRVIEEPSSVLPAFPPHPHTTAPAHSSHSHAGDSFSTQASSSSSSSSYAHSISRPASRTSRRRSPSPNSGRGRRSASTSTNPAASKKGRSRSSRNGASGPPQADSEAHSDSMNGYSSGDGAPGSVSSKAKEQIGNTEISIENIVEGGRRKRAKFESSELPLFAPPQMPAATSNPSVSPARRADPQRQSLSFVQPGPNPFTNPRSLQSPRGRGGGLGPAGMYATPGSDSRRTRASIGYAYAPGVSVGPGMSMMMPTPDPTVGSCVSEEDKDVAIQLMRLGEMSNISHGRTSASTMDDTFSGRADAASSTGATSDAESDSDGESQATRRQKLDASGYHKKIMPTTETQFVGSCDSAEVSGDDADREDVPKEGGAMAAPKLKNPKPKANTLSSVAKPRAQSSVKGKMPRPAKPKIKKPAMSIAGPMSPASLPASRKPSVVSNPALAPGEEEQPDLSTKPRCQRCRKSKKGCDRQRPCGRCRDAGIPAELCISEDEGNGRKGRYGRHMGVPIKKEDAMFAPPPVLLPPAPIAAAGVPIALDKNKKRKR